MPECAMATCGGSTPAFCAARRVASLTNAYRAARSKSTRVGIPVMRSATAARRRQRRRKGRSQPSMSGP